MYMDRPLAPFKEDSMRRSVLRTVFLGSLISFLVIACGLPTSLFNQESPTQPGNPVYSQILLDCNTGDLIDLGTPIQPHPGCDSWRINRYERPFNAGEQDRYYPDVDILGAALGRSQHWYYVRLEIYDVDQDTGRLDGMFGLEMDLDLDGRGDVLITAEILESNENISEWSSSGVQAWKDSDNDVGNEMPMKPDPAYDTDGYDAASLDPLAPSGEVWVRATLSKPSFVEIAFKPEVIDDDQDFKWWVWVDEGVSDPSGYDYHDSYARNEAGDVYTWELFFPAREVYSIDNTCAEFWGVDPPPDDPTLCINRVPPLTETPPCCGFNFWGCNGCNRYSTFTPTPEPTVTRVTPTPEPTITRVTPTPSTTPTPTLTPRPTITPSPTYFYPTRVPVTPTRCINPLGGPC